MELWVGTCVGMCIVWHGEEVGYFKHHLRLLWMLAGYNGYVG